MQNNSRNYNWADIAHNGKFAIITNKINTDIETGSWTNNMQLDYIILPCIIVGHVRRIAASIFINIIL